MSSDTGLLKERAGWLYYGVAVFCAVGGYALGFAGLFSSSLLLNIAATLLLAHAMTISAYLIHECGHNMVFRRHRDNAALGRVMSWLCGAAYGTYEDMRYKHFRHHVDNDDVVWFAYDDFFARHPIVTNITRALEWFYIPAHDLIMHILRFMDSVQHDYPYSVTLFESSRAPHKGDAEWEQEHTFSNTLSMRFPALNLWVLNFGYHNAHHADMNQPFYRSPTLHAELPGDASAHVIPFVPQVKLYHRNRVTRIFNPQLENHPKGRDYLRTAQSGSGPIGGNAASFLTSF